MTSFVLPRTDTGRTLFLSLLVGLGLTWVLLSIAHAFALDITGLETLAVLTSFICTFLCSRQSRWNYPVGVVSTALLAYVFWEQKLLGSMALNLYLIPTLIYGWFVWGPDKDTKPVANVPFRYWPVYVAVSIAVWYCGAMLLTYLGGEMGNADALILFGSILAQFLLDRKRIETWYVWFVVNIVSIALYFHTGLYLLAMQFIVFQLNTVYGYYCWKATIGKERADG